MLLGVDTGGTFTDFVLLDGTALRLHKVLSTPDDPSLAIERGIAELGIGDAVRRGAVMFVHGSTVATNAALEGNGVRTAYVTNRGFTDVLRLARQNRRELYSFNPSEPANPVPEALCVGVPGRLTPTGEIIEPITPGDLAQLRATLLALAPEAIAINLLYSYVDDAHERAVEAAIADLGFVCRSSSVLPEYREYERGIATWLNAWLGPVVERYLARLARAVAPSRVLVMQSSGGTIGADQAQRHAVNLLLSGPAGGLAAARCIGAALGRIDLMTFDMGGTSTDVSLLGERPVITNEARIGPYPVAVPMADIHTIAAGGGSIAFLDDGGALQVGPRSAAAKPGPACYGLGGTEPTVTDANVVLGRLPASLRLAGSMTLRPDLARAAVARIAKPLGVGIEYAAAGIVALANQHMARALRLISLERGHDPRNFALMSFGGAGGLHVCALATELDIREIVVPAHCGVFSALGMLCAAPMRQRVRTINRTIDALSDADLDASFAALSAPARNELIDDGADARDIVEIRSVDLRYRGQSFALSERWTSRAAVVASFHSQHRARYGHALNVPVEIVNVRCELTAPREPIALPEIDRCEPAKPRAHVATNEASNVPLFQRDELAPDQVVVGPALIVETMATTFVDTQWRGTVDRWGHLLLTRAAPTSR
ncbi:MAG TPA: hydantoinase/oxoprolinase family protein [Pseudomonadales bacterium]|nr:hydantoinase/oxoprolinase family protein [Pseudomonadales bacterium]